MNDSGERPVVVPGGRGVQAGDGNAQFNDFSANRSEQAVSGGRDAVAAGRDIITVTNIYAVPAGGPQSPVVVGDVPQEPAAFQMRAGLMDALAPTSDGQVSVVFAVTGIRGVGKTQAVAAYARRRITEGWRLVAWVDASSEASLLTGLAQVAVAVGVGVGDAGTDARVLAGRVRSWLEADGQQRLMVLGAARLK